jgi:hypothetical protein
MASREETNKINRDEQVALKHYNERLKILKKGQEFSVTGDIAKSVQYYSQYLNIIAKFHKIDEPKLTPKIFDPEKDMSEMFLISHVYWDLARAYDRTPKLNAESIRCLDQYVKFTIGFKYQYVNARTLKNFIRKRLAHNPKAFKDAFEKIQVESKGCFISSSLHGPNSPTTNRLRNFKKIILKMPMGNHFVAFYYNTLCPAYFNAQRGKYIKLLIRRPLKLLLFVFSLAFNSKSCSRV